MDPADLAPQALFHLATTAELERYRSSGAIEPASLATEGFVHCSWGHQVAGTLRKHFDGVRGLHALQLDPTRLASPVVEEDMSGSGQAFPHVYAPIDLGAVVETHALG